jgi:Tfp pilus assembly protein PilO
MNKSNLSLKTLTAKLLPVWRFAQKYAHFLFFIFLAGLVGYLLWHINSLNQAEPTDDAVTSKLKTVQRPNVDQNALNQIQQLQDQNIEVRGLFEHVRDNPFSE